MGLGKTKSWPAGCAHGGCADAAVRGGLVLNSTVALVAGNDAVVNESLYGERRTAHGVAEGSD